MLITMLGEFAGGETSAPTAIHLSLLYAISLTYCVRFVPEPVNPEVSQLNPVELLRKNAPPDDKFPATIQVVPLHAIALYCPLGPLTPLNVVNHAIPSADHWIGNSPESPEPSANI
jgi:hypothetical protein